MTSGEANVTFWLCLWYSMTTSKTFSRSISAMWRMDYFFFFFFFFWYFNNQLPADRTRDDIVTISKHEWQAEKMSTLCSADLPQREQLSSVHTILQYERKLTATLTVDPTKGASSYFDRTDTGLPPKWDVRKILIHCTNTYEQQAPKTSWARFKHKNVIIHNRSPKRRFLT